MANLSVPIQKTMPNLLHVLSPWANEEKRILNGLIEINAGSINKYEFITETGHLKLDRVGYSTLAYPTVYGLIPQTWDQDNDMLDILVANVTEPLIPGSLAEVRVIGIMKFEDGAPGPCLYRGSGPPSSGSRRITDGARNLHHGWSTD